MTEEIKRKTVIRKMEVFQSDDARRIERWEPVSKTEMRPDVEPEEIEGMQEDQPLYVGIMVIGFPGMPPKEARFAIPGVSSIEEAFEKYDGLAQETAEEVEQQFKEYVAQNQQGGKIAVAPAEALRHLDNA